MEAGHMKPPASREREPSPACPFETGARLDKINFPDVLEVLPLRGVATGDGTAVTRGARGDNTEDNTAFALEAMDVEERRARDLAECTVEKVANTSPAAFEVPENVDDEIDDAASDVSSEDELVAATRVAKLASEHLEEMRCQSYFDQKEKVARGLGGRDPALCSPVWEEESPSPGDVSGSAVGDSPSSSVCSPMPCAGSPDLRSPQFDVAHRGGETGFSRAQTRLPLTPPRRRPFGRGVRTRPRVFASVDEGDENVVPETNMARVVQKEASETRATRGVEHGGETNENEKENHLSPSNKFDSVKNGLYAAFCAEASTPWRAEAVGTPSRGDTNTHACDFAGISPIPTISHSDFPSESPDTRRERGGNIRRRSLFDFREDERGVAAAIAAIADDVSLEDSFEFDSPNATPVPNTHLPPRLNRRGGPTKTRPRTGFGLDGETEETNPARAAVRLDLVEFTRAAATPLPATPPLCHGHACATCGRSPPAVVRRYDVSRHSRAMSHDALDASDDARRFRLSPGGGSDASAAARFEFACGGSDADVSAGEDDNSARLDDSNDLRVENKVSVKARARRRHRLGARRGDRGEGESFVTGRFENTTRSKEVESADFLAKLERAVAARRPPLTPTERAVRGMAPSVVKFNTPTMLFSVSMSAGKTSAVRDKDTALRRDWRVAAQTNAPERYSVAKSPVAEDMRVLEVSTGKTLLASHTETLAFLDDSATRGSVCDSQWGVCDGPIHRALAVSFSGRKTSSGLNETKMKTKVGLETFAARDEKFATRKLDFDQNDDVTKHEDPYAFAQEIRRIVNAGAR
jgi:hypothetical protein